MAELVVRLQSAYYNRHENQLDGSNSRISDASVCYSQSFTLALSYIEAISHIAEDWMAVLCILEFRWGWTCRPFLTIPVSQSDGISHFHCCLCSLRHHIVGLLYLEPRVHG